MPERASDVAGRRSGPRWLPLLVVLVAATAGLWAQQADDDCFDPEGYTKATSTILCDCGCHPQSVHDCACGRAAEMRREIQTEMTRECLSGEALIALYVERHGDQIRIAPTATGFNLVAWLGPTAAALMAIALMLFVIRRWSRQRPPEVTVSPSVPAADDDAYRRRLQQTLEGME